MNKQTVALLALTAVAGTTLAAPRESASAPATVNVLPEPTFETFTLAFTGSDGGGPYQATRIRFAGTMTGVAPFTYAFDTIVSVTPPGSGAPVVALRMSQNYAAYTTEPIAVNASLQGSFAPAGTWSFDCTDDFVDGDGVANEATLDGLVVTLDDASAIPAASLGTLVDGTAVSQEVTLNPNELLWFKFTSSDATTASNRNLDINTLASTSGADSELGVYTSAGAMVANNDDAGGGFYSQLSFGSEGVQGDLAGGEYYLAVGTFNTTFAAADWQATSAGLGGVFQLSLLQSLIAPPAGAWNEEADGGGDAGQDLATAQVVSGTGELSRITASFGVDDVDIFKINICDVASFSATTSGTMPAIDTQMFLFNPDGTGVVMNDDTVGLTSTIDGTTGFILANGDYYLAVSRYDIDPVDASAQALWMDQPFAGQRQPDGPGAGGVLASWEGSNVTTGNYRIDFTGACKTSGGSGCGPADIGQTGGIPGADNHLDNNDFVVYIDTFFAHAASADIGVTGGVAGNDGVWDNNDFVVYIDQFFNAPATCRS